MAKSIFGIDDSVPMAGNEDVFRFRKNSQIVDPSFYTPEELESFKKYAERKNIEEKAAEIIPEKTIIGDDAIEWELRAPYDGDKKRLYFYDESIERCKQISPNNRHPYSHEVFGLIMNGLEGKLSGNGKIVFDDMLNSNGEWLGQAFMRESEETLIVYYDPNLIYDPNIILQRNMRIYFTDSDKLEYSRMEVFEVSSRIPPLFSTPLDRLNPEFVKAMYGREYSELPQAMKVRGGAYVSLPPVEKKRIWPLCRDKFTVCGSYYFGAASRGVAIK